MKHPKQTYRIYLTFNDLLLEHVSLYGLELDAKVSCEVERTGEDCYEVSSLDIGPISIYVDAFDSYLKVDHECLETKFPQIVTKFREACEIVAIKRAAQTPDILWTHDLLEDDCDRSDP